ncbi:MAG: hypothetical protein ACRDL8_11570, partial [Solirubrobacteraceae bacterium]
VHHGRALPLHRPLVRAEPGPLPMSRGIAPAPGHAARGANRSATLRAEQSCDDARLTGVPARALRDDVSGIRRRVEAGSGCL